MHYFPICLDITGRHCAVIGGGRVAERKVRALMEHAARVTVISPEVTEELAVFHAEGRLAWLKREYREDDLADVFLVIAATDDPEVQRRVHAEADKHNILLNVADVPKWCNFILPATVRRGDLSISVSTGGKSPALASRLRKELEKQFGPEYEVLLYLLGRLRSDVLARGKPHEENKDLFNQLLHPKMVEWVRNGDWESVETHIRNNVDSEIASASVQDAKILYKQAFAGSELK